MTSSKEDTVVFFDWLMGAAMSFDHWGKRYHGSHGYKVQLANEIFLGNLPSIAKLPSTCCRCQKDTVSEKEMWPSPSVPGGFECTGCCCGFVKDMAPVSDVRYAIIVVNGLYRPFSSYESFSQAVWKVADGLSKAMIHV